MCLFKDNFFRIRYIYTYLFGGLYSSFKHVVMKENPWIHFHQSAIPVSRTLNVLCYFFFSSCTQSVPVAHIRTTTIPVLCFPKYLCARHHTNTYMHTFVCDYRYCLENLTGEYSLRAFYTLGNLCYAQEIHVSENIWWHLLANKVNCHKS